ncbi:hypothetical protein MTO96_033890 [Rhipicephalus appendiculatus]
MPISDEPMPTKVLIMIQDTCHELWYNVSAPGHVPHGVRSAPATSPLLDIASDGICTTASRLLGVLHLKKPAIQAVHSLNCTPAAAFAIWYARRVDWRPALTPRDDVQRLLSRCRPCPRFYLMAVGVLRPAVHDTPLNNTNMSAMGCTSRPSHRCLQSMTSTAHGSASRLGITILRAVHRHSGKLHPPATTQAVPEDSVTPL